MTIQLYNTRTRQKEDLQPITPGRLAMYHCGPTVYSSPHIGNFRSFLLADLMRRFFEDQGFEVTQVMNVTDVGHMTDDDEDAGEDKMLAASKKEQLDPYEIARRYEGEFRECLDLLGFRLPHHLPRATDHIQEMGVIIADLLDQGIAYQVNGNVYFEIDKFANYGSLSGKVIDDLEEGARVAVNEEKRDPRDFALWKTDDKHLMQWDAPFPGGQRGFPGWHIECSAMAMKYLGESFDLHTGGEDNLFPHHECEVAQSEASTGKLFVRTWLHVKHLLVEGQKMSKSLGNFLTVSQVLEKGYTGAELRYAMMKVQYRQSLNFTWAGMQDARASIRRVRQAWEQVVRVVDGGTGGSDDLSAQVETAHADFTAALADDLNTSVALAAVFALVSAANKATLDPASAELVDQAFARFEDVLGVFGTRPTLNEEAPADLVEMAQAREDARQDRDFAEADRLRDQIQAAGYKIVDTAEGPRLERI
ncbi:MAG: cysteine--tRNA ligase [Planctomycetota bacterium]|nr:cysteine--tRNA ligase [Planctomycetota bacterium]